MPRDYDFDFEEEDIRPQRPQRQPRAPRQPQGGMRGDMGGMRGDMGGMRGDMGGMRERDRMPQRGGSRKKKNDTKSLIILIVEIVVFIALLVTFILLLKNKNSAGSDSAAATEASAESGESSGGVNVDGPNFTLTCTKVQLATDIDGNPAALIYFTFVNKTDTPLSMNEVYPPSVKQNGIDCSTNAILAEQPAEVANAATQISGGGSIECCYAISLQDFTSTLTLTIHDSYETFTDIGSTDIPLS